MGGLGSGRPSTAYRIQVEQCKRLPISGLVLAPGNYASLSWSTGSINYLVTGQTPVTGVRLMYAINGEQYDYKVELTTDRTPWGSVRYWFRCPTCRRRCSVLYLPPFRRIFACRLCGGLVYKSQYEKRSSFTTFYRSMAGEMQADHPGMTAADLEWAFNSQIGGKMVLPPPGGYFARQLAEEAQARLDEWRSYYDDYLDRAQLCKQAGLTTEDLDRLEAARLLLPDHEGLYRPKLAGWGRKLAYLLGEGWPVESIRRWAKGRWGTEDPRQWPPVLEEWS